MIEAWDWSRFRTYFTLPGWTGDPWSLLLVPGWRGLIGRPLEDVVAHQWATTTNLLLDDLEALPSTRWVGIRYDARVAHPQVEIQRLCARHDVHWTGALQSLPWRKVRRGWAHGTPREPGWEPALVAMRPGAVAAFAMESTNFPAVMSPWELDAHFRLLFDDAMPHPRLAQVQQLATDLAKTRRGL